MQKALLKLVLLALVVIPFTSEAKQHAKQIRHHTILQVKAPKKAPKTLRAKHTIPVKSAKSVKAVNSGIDGIASWYGPRFHGHKTKSGEVYNQNALTAAHKSIPIGSLVQVTNVKNHKSVIVRINDFGPHVKGRIIDLSKRAADTIKIDGIGMVHLSIVKPAKS
jgi:rare lipoprotein A